MSPHKQAWQHFSCPRGTKFPQGRCPGYGQRLPQGQPVSDSTNAVPGAPSPAWDHSPLKHSSRSLPRATVGSPSTSWKSAILRGAKPRASSGVGTGNPRPPLPEPPEPSERPIPQSPQPAQRSPGNGGEGKEPSPCPEPSTDLLWCSRDMAAPQPLPRAPHKRSGWKRCPGRGMRDGPRPPPGPAPEGVATPPAPRGSRAKPRPRRLRAPFPSAGPRPLRDKDPPLRAPPTAPSPAPAPRA